MNRFVIVWYNGNCTVATVNNIKNKLTEVDADSFVVYINNGGTLEPVSKEQLVELIG